MKNLHTFNELPAEHYKSLFALENSYWWHVSRIKWVKYIVSKFFHTTQKLSVLDFGCGTGGGLEQLKKIFNFKDAVGVDASEMAIRFAKTYSKDYHLISHNSYKMESQFDIIFLMDVLEHIDDDEKFLNELKKNLKDDGVIILSVPGLQTLFSDWDRQLGHFRRYNERNLVDLANNTNLMVEFTSYGFSLITPVVFWKRKMSSSSDVDSSNSEFPEVSPILNKFLTFSSQIEIFISKFIHLPFGTSLFCVLRKSNK